VTEVLSFDLDLTGKEAALEVIPKYSSTLINLDHTRVVIVPSSTFVGLTFQAVFGFRRARDSTKHFRAWELLKK
jgi:hypothetical protein